MKKKIIIALLLISMFTTPCFAVNFFDMVIYKKVVLVANHMTVLVNRITGEVKYIRLNNGNWIPAAGTLKTQCQSMYNAQTGRK